MTDYFVYMVECKYGTYYTGYTNDIPKRLEEHNQGKGAKYLRGKGPVKLVFSQKWATAKMAQAQERSIKLLSRQKKEILIRRSDLERRKGEGLKTHLDPSLRSPARVLSREAAGGQDGK